jgi:predicted DCC family thiol-disulfide oxidoreductase YuxK
VCYDDQCAFCVGWAASLRRLLERRGFALVPLQSLAVRSRLKAAAEEDRDEMKVITHNGSVFGGADGLIYLARSIPWGWPVFALAAIPGMKSVLCSAYRFVARHRGCTGRVGACAARRKEPTARTRWSGWLSFQRKS